MAGLGASMNDPCSEAIAEMTYDGLASVVIDTRILARLLGYPSANAVRQAHRRGTLPVPLYRLDGRRGLFARPGDITKALRETLRRDCPVTRSPIGLGAEEPNSRQEVQSEAALRDPHDQLRRAPP